MLLALSIVSEQGADLGATAYKVFDERGGSIGRVAGNDWVLPDANNFVSSRHARVSANGGIFYLEDTSSNGTFINAPDHLTSRGQPQRLTDGDRLYIGDYEIIVQLIPSGPSDVAGRLGVVDQDTVLSGASGAANYRAPASGNVSRAADLAPSVPPREKESADGALSRRGSDPTPSRGSPDSAMSRRDSDLAMSHGSSDVVPSRGSSDLALSSLGLGTVDPLAALGGTLQPAVTSAPGEALPSARADGKSSVGPHFAESAASKVFSALGLDPSKIDPALQQQIAPILRLTVQGLVDVLRSRAEVKNSFRLPTTSIKPVENNPLKFSQNADDALQSLFIKRNAGYLGPVEAVEEGFSDINAHQAAVLAGIRAAFNAMLARLHPQKLEELYDRKLKRTAMLGIGNKAKYWDMYRAQFEEIDRDREAHFQILFGEDFALAYNDHLQKLAATSRLRK